MQKMLLGLICVVAVGMGAMIFHFLSRSDLDGLEVTWEVLNQLDYVTGEAPAELKAFDGKKIKVPGFMVPLEDNQQQVHEFLLVPTPQACIHVPAPPPNQMVYVKMKNPVPAASGPIWTYGELKIAPKRHMYGEASFELVGEAIESYR